MLALSGYTSNGIEITCLVNQEKGEAYVELESDPAMRFSFNPDFPEDARAFFVALCNVTKIEIDE